ncbi:hypothetical protein [Rhodovulum sp. MB263]|uniref:hypothetical protein n=1 Tax=Rhodovulum sp. (strain MB263) TaxID=308754 RepID=UPI0009B7BCCF|nr:hypothetical protein [Rhodovulum sp. MB263]ARC90360.1 hypothetical protein B5V46_18030 [Rhodovulum sp. MB263]
MTDLSARGPLGLKAPRVPDDPDHLARIRSLPCCICAEWGLPQLSPTQAHHCIHGRFSTRRAPDCMAIPLCEGHHQGLLDGSKLALHQAPSRWRRLYGNDTDWISWAEDRLHKEEENKI